MRTDQMVEPEEPAQPVRIEMDKFEAIPVELLQGRSRQEWLWLPDAAKAALGQTATEPEWNE